MTTRRSLFSWLCALLLLAGCFDVNRVTLGSDVKPDAGDDDDEKSDDNHSDDHKKSDAGS